MNTWRDEAACLGHDPELWHDYGHDGPWPPAADTENSEAARNICNSCPVREACLKDAMQYVKRSDTPLTAYGIFGGLDAQERYRLVFPDKRPHWNSEKTHCSRGHEYAGDNLIITARGTRRCRLCARLVNARSKAKIRAARKAKEDAA